MKKMSRKNFRGGPLFSSKSSSSAASHGPSSSSPGLNGAGGGIMRRATWADKIRDKLPPLGENEYEVLWERGVLGVIFLESEKDGIPYVSKATESCISPAVSQGDILKFVNVVRSKDHSFSDFFKILATMKKPVLLRFERISASTPSSDEDEASQLFGVQRSSSTNAVNSASHYARQNVPNPEEGDPTGKLQRANSVPQKDQKPPKATRGAFWRATGAKDSVNPAQSVGPNGVNGGNDRLAASQTPRRVPSNREQVSPRDAMAASGSGSRAAHSPLGPHEYQVYWETGSLGLFFGEDRATNLPVVTRSTPSANPVVRRAVAINDTLVSANGIKSADYTFEAFFGRLQQMNKPVRLVFRRRQPNDQVVIVKQGEQQQQQRQQQQQQQLQQQLQQRQQQMREQQETREQEQKRELHKIRDQQQHEQQQREQQQLHEQHLREQQQREKQAREQHEQQQRMKLQLEQQQREQQQREQQQREQQQREQQQREQQQRKQQQREQQQREQQLREKQLREQQEREAQLREQQEREEKRQQEEAALRNRTPSVSVDTSPSSSTSPPESRTPHRNRSPSPTVKRASTPPPRPPSPQVRQESSESHREHRHADRANMRTPPPISPIMPRKQETVENTPSTNYDVSPKASMPPMVRSSPRVNMSPKFGISPSASPHIGSSPKVSSSPLASPFSPFAATEVANDEHNLGSSPVQQVEDDLFTQESAPSPKQSQHIFEKSQGRRSRNSSEEQRQHMKASVAVHEEEPVLSPVSKNTHLSPTEPWDLPEQLPSPTIKSDPIRADEEDDVDVGVLLSPSAQSHLEHVTMAEEVELAEEAELVEEAELAEEGHLVEEAVVAEEVEFTEAAELADEVEEAEPAVPSHPVDNSVEDEVEVGMLADVEVGIAVEETKSEVVESSDQNPWDLEPESDHHKTHRHGSSRDEALSSSGHSPIESVVEAPKVDFADAAEPTDEFANDPDIAGDIDSVDSEIMMQEAPKGKMDSANLPKPSKPSLNANLAKYKKKGKTARGVIKLPALAEEEALTVPLVAPNAVNTTVQVRGRPKPKLTMADTPDSTTYLIKWKENRSIGLQLKEVRLAKGTYPLVTDVCQEPCCELLRHICVGDVIIEINGRNTSTMGVKKTVNFFKTCTKTTLMKIRHGPGFVNQRVSATV